jgi:hypothetical protein
MMKPKTKVDLALSLDGNGPPRQSVTLMELVTEARAIEWDFTTWCCVSGHDASDPEARRMFECLLAYPGARVAFSGIPATTAIETPRPMVSRGSGGH